MLRLTASIGPTAALLLLLALALPGCARPVKSAADNPLEVDPLEYDRLFQASVLVLREHGFWVDRQDYRFGIVTTRPGPTQFPSRPALGPRSTTSQRAEDLLNHQRRVVRVSFTPLAPASQTPAPADADAAPTLTPTPAAYHLAVEVVVQRQTVPARHLTGSTLGYGGQGRLAAAPDELADHGLAPASWIDLARDEHLEQRLLAAIVRRSLQLR